jgi:MFS family permease
VPGQLTNGMIVDRIFTRHRDAHLRYYAFACIAIAILGFSAPFSPHAWLYLALLGPTKFLMNYGGVQIATLQVVTPAAIRGRMTALAGIVSSLLGGTLGPSIVAFFTDQVFKDENKVGMSLGVTFAIFVPLAGLLFWIGMKPMAEA